MEQQTLAAKIIAACKRELRRQLDAGAGLLNWEELVRRTGYSRRQIDRMFREVEGITPVGLLAEWRADRGAGLLGAGHDVLGAALRAGYSGPGRLHDAMIAFRGLTPGELRRGGDGVRIAMGLFETSLGMVLMAATERGLCLLKFSDEDSLATRLRELWEDYPNAEFQEDSAALEPYRDGLQDFLARRASDFEPAVDPKGTAFQRQVWAELRRVRPGETATYSDIATRIGRPRAVRAVASACANNPVAVAVPCHRIIARSGALSGYRWGLERKRALLELEGNCPDLS